MYDSGFEHGVGEGGTGGIHQGHSSVRREGAASRAPAVLAGPSEVQIQKEDLVVDQDDSHKLVEPPTFPAGPSVEEVINSLNHAGLQQLEAAKLASALNDKIPRLLARTHVANPASQPPSLAPSSSVSSSPSPDPSPPIFEREGPIPRPGNWSIYDRSAYNLQERREEARVRTEIARRKRLAREKEARRRARG